MASDLIKYIHNMSKDFLADDHDDFSGASFAEQLLYLYSYYHYFNADASCIGDIDAGRVFDAFSGDHISGIYIDQDSDFLDVDALMVVPSDEFEYPACLKYFKDAELLLFDGSTGKSSCRKVLVDTLSNDDLRFSSTKPLKIRLVTDFNPKNATAKNSISKAVQALKPDHAYVYYDIIFGYDIEFEILEIEDPKEYVDRATVKIDCAMNSLTFGDEKSIIVNISAKSLQSLYVQYGYRGLFAQNLRYYVKNAKIDDKIVNSIEDRPGEFWYLNNGIILICDDYYICGTSITIVRFSIINGGQTTKLIGESEFSQDFFVQCKIIKNRFSIEEQRIAFISRVAEASNTQKPIKEKDLIANRTEQRILKRHLAEHGIYCQIKRGEKVNKKLYPNPWQNTTNEELAQFLLSFVYQKPGIARAQKASICGNKERYDLIFQKEYNCDFMADLLVVKAYYKLWMIETKKKEDGADPYKVGLINNGIHIMTAIIGVLVKLYYHLDYIDKINDTLISEQKLEIASQHDIDHHFLQQNTSKQMMYQLFEYCYLNFYRPGYEFLKSFKPNYSSYANFAKVNGNYTTYVFRYILSELRNGFSDYDIEYLKSVFYTVSDEELSRDEELLSQYINLVSADISKATEVSCALTEAISDALTEYRTRVYKANRIKAYEVFKNVARDRIAKYAPETIDDLRSLRCLDDAHLELYGDNILRIIKEEKQKQSN